VIFPNGDRKECLADGTVVYHYESTKATQTTFPNGLELFKFNNGQVEKHYPDGVKEITFTNGTQKTIYGDGSEEMRYADGSVVRKPRKEDR
jgi:centromere protein J